MLPNFRAPVYSYITYYYTMHMYFYCCSEVLLYQIPTHEKLLFDLCLVVAFVVIVVLSSLTIRDQSLPLTLCCASTIVFPLSNPKCVHHLPVPICTYFSYKYSDVHALLLLLLVLPIHIYGLVLYSFDQYLDFRSGGNCTTFDTAIALHGLPVFICLTSILAFPLSNPISKFHLPASICYNILPYNSDVHEHLLLLLDLPIPILYHDLNQHNLF